MEYIRLSEIDLKQNINMRVFVKFLARDVNVRLQRDKTSKFINLNMVDKDVVIEAKIFGATDSVIELVKDGKVYVAAVDVKPYDKAPCGYSCIIYNMDNCNETPESYVEWADDLDNCQKVIENILPDIIDTYYGQIAYPLLVENWEQFATWSAATGQHHTRLGELLVHTSEVVAMCDQLGDYFNDIYYPGFINKALLLSAAMIHDLAKIHELNVDALSGKIEYSTHAALSSHIMDIIGAVEVLAYNLGIGRRLTDEIVLEGHADGGKTDEQLEEEREAIDLLKHCLAAHHGKLEWGSPIVPNVPEAFLLHVADQMSAEMYKFNKTFKELDPGKSISTWTHNGNKTTYKDSSK